MSSPELTIDQRAAREAFAALLEQPAEADRLYNSLPDTRGGKVISSDLARFLDARYRNTADGQPRDLIPGWDLAWRYAHARFNRELRSRAGRTIVQFMAGGWAAGKTHSVGASEADLTWDGTLKDLKWAEMMIDLALRTGWLVEVDFVFRDIEIALYGAVERAGTEGRSVPLEELPGNHRAVQKSICGLITRYGINERVSFALLHNTGGLLGVRGKSLRFAETQLAPGGALHYSEEHEQYYRQVAGQIQGLNSPRKEGEGAGEEGEARRHAGEG